MAFHTFDINEIYSNADGSVQFVELLEVENADDQDRFRGHTLTVTQGNQVHTFTFGKDLSNSQTANKTVLIATQGFANLGIATPDYFIPAGFLFTNGGTLNFAGFDTVSYTQLPSNGTSSVNRSGTVAAATPRNFAGVTGTLPQPNHAPTGTVTVDGVLFEGETLRANTSTLADTDGLGPLQYQWLRGAVSIVGATASSYQLIHADAGQQITLRVTYTDLLGHSELVSSAPTPIVGGLVRGSAAPETLNGGEGADQIYPGLGNDLVHGNGGDDSVYARDSLAPAGISEGNDTIFGDAGDDFLSAFQGLGNHSMDGGAGNDTLDTGSGNDTLLGGDGNDLLSAQGRSGSHLLDGGIGDDQLFAGDGSNTLIGGTGADTLFGGNGGGSMSGGDGADLLSSQGVLGNHALDGGVGNDTLYGGNGQDTLQGGSGNDSLTGGDGANALSGGVGADTLFGGSGDSTLEGGDGNDLLSSQGSSGNHLLDGGLGDDTLYGADGQDTLQGGAGNDSIYGGNVASTLVGGDGDDTLSVTSRFGNHRLEGGAGRDSLYGGNGNDTLDGGSGTSLLWGAGGNDSYLIGSRNFDLYDTGGIDTAIVGTSFVKLPTSIENVSYSNGALELPYWIDALLDGSAANFSTLLGPARTLNYTFPAALPAYDTAPADANGYQPFNAAQKAFAQQALAYVSTVLDLGFVQTTVADAANTIAFANNLQTGSAGYAAFPSESANGSDLFLDVDTPGNLTPADGQPVALTLMHELGHAFGLKHPFSHADAAGQFGPGPYLPVAEEITAWTVLSYNQNDAQFHLTYSPLDIAALQYLYGPNRAVRAGNDTYALSASGPNFIWDGNGSDTLDAQLQTLPVTLYLEPGYWGFIGEQAQTITAAGQVTVNFGSRIENLLGGSGADQLFGNTADNAITGGAGNDSLQGGAGNDSFVFAAQGNGIDQITDFAPGDAIRITGASLAGVVSLGNGAALGANQVQLSSANGGSTLYIGTDATPGADIEIHLGGPLAPADLQLAGSQINFGSPAKSAELLAYSWKAHTLLSGVEVDSPEHNASTDASGAAVFTAVTEASLTLRVERPVPAAENAATSTAVNLQDAIAILKMIVGLDVNGANKPLSPYQALAADFDGNGSVGLTDAIGVLKHVVGLPSPEPAWHFANEADTSMPARAGLSPGLAPAVNADFGSNSPVHIGLVGYLSGDVDGSFAGAPGAADLDLTQPGYFQALVAAVPGLSLAQFGVYS